MDQSNSKLDSIREFVMRHVEDEWDRLILQVSSLSQSLMLWSPASGVHSVGWHIRHVLDWRYALVHCLVCRHKVDEPLTCLGWEKEPLIQGLSSTAGWFEPRFSIEANLRYAAHVRSITNRDIEDLDPALYWTPVKFPWRNNLLLDEIFQDVRHSALHRGQIREIRKAYLRRVVFETRSQRVQILVS